MRVFVFVCVNWQIANETKSRPNCFLHRSVPSSNNVAATTYHWPTSPILPPISSRTPHLVPDTHLMSSNGSNAVNNYTSSNKYGSWIIEDNRSSATTAIASNNTTITTATTSSQYDTATPTINSYKANINRRSSATAIVDIEMFAMGPLANKYNKAFARPASITKSISASAASTDNNNDYQQQYQQQQQFLQQLQHLQHKEKFLKNYIVPHAIHPQCGLPESLRIIETVIAEDAETNANTPESQTDTTTTTTTNSSLHLIQQLQHQSAANVMAASSTSSSLSIYNTALPQSFSFSPSSTMTTDATTNTSFMTASASVPTSVSAASSNTSSTNNKFTRKRERVCNSTSNSNTAISKLANCSRAFSK